MQYDALRNAYEVWGEEEGTRLKKIQLYDNMTNLSKYWDDIMINKTTHVPVLIDRTQINSTQR